MKYDAIQYSEQPNAQDQNETDKLSKAKNYLRIAILVIATILIIEAIINYERIVPRFQAYLLWA